MQTKDISIQEAIAGAKLLSTHLKSLRYETIFDSFYDSVLHGSRNLTEEPSLPHHREIPIRFDSGAAPHLYQTLKDRYRHTYYEMLELTSGEVERRFDQADVMTIKELELHVLNAKNRKGRPTSSSSPEILAVNVDVEHLKDQLSLLQVMIMTASETASVTKFTNIRTVADAMNKSSIYKNIMLSELDKLLNMYYTFPVTTAAPKH